jgi:DNA-directed RNA polymerase sigma subunit (sigma70/sigma32)
VASNQRIADCAIRTQAEVAKELGISRARVMQIEQSALRKLRKALTRQQYRRLRLPVVG